MRWWLRALRKPRPAELDREIEFHIEELVREKMAGGLGEAEARREARLEFGGSEQVKEEVREVHRIPVWDAGWTHTRYAVRTLKASWTFSLAVIATLTLGIGANTAVFSAIDAVLLRPLPYPEPGRLVVMHEWRAKPRNADRPVAPSRLEDWNRMNRTFQAISGYYMEDTVDATGPLPVRLKRAIVAPRFLEVMGVAPEIGRDFTQADEHFHGVTGLSVLISDRYWRTHFHGDPGAIGQPLMKDRKSARVIGVMPPGFAFPDESVDLWFVNAPDAPYARDRRETWFTAIGRMKRGVAEGQARADLDLVQRRLGREYPATDADLSVKLESLRETTIGGERASLWLLFAGVTLLLLIACVNVSSLLLARCVERGHEFSVRYSLGASRAVVASQVMVESLILALAGSAAALVVALVCGRAMKSMAAAIPRIGGIGMDWRVFAYAAACAVVVTLISGLYPALRAGLAAPAGWLAKGGRTEVTRGGRAQAVLVGVQVALAVCLLAGAGLLVRSFAAMTQVSPGFEASHVLVFRLTGGYGETGDVPRLMSRVNQVLDALRRMPGVEAASASVFLPGVPVEYPLELTSPDSGFEPERRVTAETRYVSSGYFETMRIPVLVGSGCDTRLEGAGVVVNRSFVSAYYEGRTAIGRHLAERVDPYGFGTREIRGIVGDAREAGLDRAPGPAVYWCGAPIDPGRYYLVRSAGDPAALAAAVRRALKEIEPSRAVYDVAPLERHLSEAYGDVRLRMELLGLFALTALMLACVGMYGTLTYFVGRRRKEIGLRMALGAGRARLALRFAGRGMAVAGVGMAAGLGLSAWAVRLMAGMLYGVKPEDPVTFAWAAMAMMGVALAATSIPAVRASRVKPMDALREE
jgi:putative ABC transport system permease protein